MGGRPLTALNLLGIPADKISPQIVQQILRGGVEKAKEAELCRGRRPHHSHARTDLWHGRDRARLPQKNADQCESAKRVIIVLTKPLGTGIVTTGIKRGLTSRGLAKKTISLMCRLNSLGAILAERGLVEAAVDITGFGLLGHLASMCRASKVSAEISPAAVPAISREIFSLIERDCIPGGSRQNLETANAHSDWNDTPQPLRSLLTDAQTSGGMLLCVPQKCRARVFQILRRGRAAIRDHRGSDCVQAGSTPMHDRLKSRREIPAVGKLLQQVDCVVLPHALVVKTIRTQLATERKSVGAEKTFANESTTLWSNCVEPDCNRSSTALAFLFIRISDASL